MVCAAAASTRVMKWLAASRGDNDILHFAVYEKLIKIGHQKFKKFMVVTFK